MTALAVLLTGVPIMAADDLELSFRDGRVTVIATDVPVRTILEEWSRVGQTVFVDGDKLTSQPVRLQLVDVPEAYALRVLLRQAAGYVAAPRTVATHDASRFDRVLVMATSRRPATSTYTPPLGSSGPVPVQQGPTTSVPWLGPWSSPQDIGTDELEELREILPQPFNLFDRSVQPVNQPSQETAPTTSRPGIVVAPSDDQPVVFIRRPVRPQSPDTPRQ